MQLRVIEKMQDEIILHGDIAPGGKASHSNMRTIIDDMAKELEGRLIVLALGPEAVGREARKHLRKWAMQGNICFLCISHDDP